MWQSFYRGKRVLVTGHTGFKGSWLSLWLLKMGAKVVGYSAYIPSEPSNFEVCRLAELMDHELGDVRDIDRLSQVIQQYQPEIIFHLAAQPIVTTSYAEPRLTFETNVMGTVNVLEVARKTPSVKATLCITSDKCYENVEWEYGYRETDHLGGKDPYSASKAAAEAAISAYARSFFDKGQDQRIASTRAGNVIGGGDWAKDRIVPDTMRAWSQDQGVDVRNPIATRPWQHVLEPLCGYLHLMTRLAGDSGKALHGESFNFGPSERVNESVGELLTAMGQYWPGKIWNDCSDPATIQKEAGLLKLNCDKARFRLEWNATLLLQETVQMTVDWYRTYYEQLSDMQAFTLGQIDSYENLMKARGSVCL